MPPDSLRVRPPPADRPRRRAKPDPATQYQRLLAVRLPEALATRYAPPSPCVSVCHMDAQTGWCLGCLRTIEEIGTWAGNSDQDKREVWQRIGQRLEFLK
ncbi:MAG: DUF1289 domain-containing protein [Betaproteobacteria bacterium]